MNEHYSNKPIKGLNLDSFPTEVQNTEWTYLLNGVLEGENSSVFKLQNEPGTALVASIPYTVIGHISISRSKKIIFSTNNIESEIGVFDNDVYTTLINTPDLNFKTNQLVRGEYKIKNGCETVIYFNDFYNSDRAINIDRLGSYKNEAGDWVVEEFKLNPNITLPLVSNLEVLSDNGTLKIGTYSFAIELLDEDLNSLGFGPVSNPVAIFDDRLNENYKSISGAYNLEDQVAEDGGVPETNKSIRIEISNLDTKFKYARVWVLEKTSVTGLNVNTYKLSSLLPIQSSTDSFLFSGISSTDTTSSVEEVVTRNAFYDRSRVIEQVDNRLVRANLKSESRDYSNYQNISNSITTKWVSKEVSPYDIESKGTSKNPNTYFDSVGFMGDEIYAFSIQYIFKSGQTSPAFHIPGRASNANDIIELTVGSTIDEREVKHLTLTTGTVPKWKVYNTADNQGGMAYHESENSTYPILTDCNGVPIYGDLAGEPIRHHRFPDRRRVPVYGGQFENIKLNVLGIEFDNITYPDSDIVGHRILMVKRTDENKTVLDNGVLTGGNIVGDRYEYVRLQDAPYINGTDVFFWSPETLVNRKYLNGSYFKINSIIERSNLTEQTDTYNKSGGGDFDIRTTEYRGIAGNTLPAETHVTYDKNYFIEPQTSTYTNEFPELFNTEASTLVFNNSFTNTINYYALTDFLFESADNLGGEKLVNVSNKKVNDPYTNISNLIYTPITSVLTGSDATVFNGDTFISEFNVMDLYNKSLNGNNILYFATYLTETWVESQVNYELVHGGLDVNERYRYPNRYGDYWINKVAVSTTDDYVAKDPELEFYGYNKNYSNFYSPEISVALPITYNYCSECQEEYPNRIIYSEKSFTEETSDGYKVFKVNNLVTVGANKGAITALHYDKNRILVRTEESRFQLAPNPQVINTDQGSTYIGTGDFLSIPPNELISTDYGYAGGSGKLDEINTEYGLVSVDEGAGQIMWFTQGIRELSSKELRCQKWLKHNLPLNLKQQIPTSGDESYVQLVYDPNYKRLLINKKDFIVKKYVGLKSETVQDGLVYSKESGFEYRKNEVYVPVSLTNTTFFTDVSWVLSVSLETQSFIGFHSYIDSYLFENKQRLYFVNDKTIYKQSANNFTKFFGTKYDFAVETVVTKPQTTNLENVIYHATSFSDNKVIDFPTFDKMWVYCTDQSTGMQTLVEKKDWNFVWDNTTKYVARPERDYLINKLADLSTSNNIVTDSVTNKQPLSIDYERDQRLLIPLKDKWFKVRLYFNPINDIKLMYDFVQTALRNSIL